MSFSLPLLSNKCHLKQPNHGLLESPTGTGKTLSLLCSSLSWLKNKKDEMKNFRKTKKTRDNGSLAEDPIVESPYFSEESSPSFPDPEAAGKTSSNDVTKPFKIVYSSRTHKQLQQSLKEMKKTEYKKSMAAVTLASRDYYCIHGKVSRLPSLNEKNNACHELGNKCEYRRNKNYAAIKKKLAVKMKKKDSRIIDIEDLVSAGKACQVCPYFASQVVAQTSDVVFSPYNYILEQKPLELTNTSIIFDEGHNIEGACEDAASGTFTSFNLRSIITGLEEIIEWQEYSDAVPPVQGFLGSKDIQLPSSEDMRNLKRFYEQFLSCLESHFLPNLKTPNNRKPWETDPVVFKPHLAWFLDILTKEPLNLLEGNAIDDYRTTASAIIDYVKAGDVKVRSFVGKGKFVFIAALTLMGDFFGKVFAHLPSETDASKSTANSSPLTIFSSFLRRNFRLAAETIIPDDSVKFKGKNKRKSSDDSIIEWKLTLYCLNPGVTIDRLVKDGTRSIIITSGTLAPMDSFESEMGIPFAQKLCNPHVIPKDQLMIFNVSRVRNCIMDASYKALQDNGNNYFTSLGHGISEYVKVIPHGILLFFKSYKFKDDCMRVWRESGYYSKIVDFKEIFDEPKKRDDFSSVLKKYKNCIDSGKGAILTAVFRGKVSEGLDMANDYCRAAIIIGLPYAFWKDPYVELKMEYLKFLTAVSSRNDSRACINESGSKTLSSHVSPNNWYEIQMLRAVNQAIGRIVRHRHDYGIVMLIDDKFKNPKTQRGLSLWLQEFIREDSDFKGKVFTEFFAINERKAIDRLENPTQEDPVVEVADLDLSQTTIIIDLSQDESTQILEEMDMPNESRSPTREEIKQVSDSMSIMSPEKPEPKKLKSSHESLNEERETNKGNEANRSLFILEEKEEEITVNPSESLTTSTPKTKISHLFSTPRALGSSKDYSFIPLDITLTTQAITPDMSSKKASSSQVKKISSNESMEAMFDDGTDDAVFMFFEDKQSAGQGVDDVITMDSSDDDVKVISSDSKPVAVVNPCFGMTVDIKSTPMTFNDAQSLASSSSKSLKGNKVGNAVKKLESMTKGRIKSDTEINEALSQLESSMSTELKNVLGKQYIAKMRKNVHEFKQDKDIEKYITAVRSVIQVCNLSTHLLQLPLTRVAASFVHFSDESERKSFLAACLVVKKTLL